VALGRRGQRGLPESGESGGAIGRGRGMRGGGSHQGSVLAGVGAGKAGGERGRRRGSAALHLGVWRGSMECGATHEAMSFYRT
jgi:hypothetical protein